MRRGVLITYPTPLFFPHMQGENMTFELLESERVYKARAFNILRDRVRLPNSAETEY